MKAPEPVFRRLVASGAVTLALLLTSCSMSLSAEVVPGAPTGTPIVGAAAVEQSAAAATATPEVTPTATPTAEPTATATATDTATPDMTATAGAAIRAQWVVATHQMLQIDSTLTDIGTRFQNGSLNTGAAAGQLRQLDQQAAAVTKVVDGLAPLPGVDAATLTHYHQTVDQWAAAIRDVDAKVSANDIFQAPGAVSHLEQIAGDLEQQAANMGLANG
jgi:hypothetical protein